MFILMCKQTLFKCVRYCYKMIVTSVFNLSATPMKKKIFWKLKFLYLLSFCHTLDSFRTTVNLKMERSLQTSQLLFQVNLNNFNPWIKPYTPVYTKMIVVSFKRHDFYIENHLAWIAYLYNLLCNYLHEGFFFYKELISNICTVWG